MTPFVAPMGTPRRPLPRSVLGRMYELIDAGRVVSAALHRGEEVRPLVFAWGAVCSDLLEENRTRGVATPAEAGAFVDLRAWCRELDRIETLNACGVFP